MTSVKQHLINETYYKASEIRLFGLVMCINYILFFFVFDRHSNHLEISLIFRIIASLSCLPLITKSFSKDLTLVHKVYWYITLTYCLPFFFTFMTLLNNLSATWLMNSVSATFLLIFILPLKQFFISFLVGLGSAIIAYKYYLGYNIAVKPSSITLFDILATYFAVVIIGSIFAYKRKFIEFERQALSTKVRLINQELESIVTERTQELEQALLAKTEFLNNMSHEIRTPIGGMSIISKELLESWESFTEDRRIELAKAVSTNAERLRILVGNLLDLAKFSNGKMLLDLKKIDLNQLVREMIIEAESLYLHGKNINFSFNFISENDAIIDAERISQVLRNLFVNAIKFSPNNSTITINIVGSEITYDDGLKVEALHLTITDQGIGIPEYEFDAIFNPFIQSSKTKTKAGGTGLGLAICKNIIEAHHGEIWAENMIGARFNFLIPKFQAKEMAKHHIILENDIVATKRDLDVKANIVMIDDEEACLLSMELILSGTNYTLIKFENGYDALAYMKSGAPIDLILLDLMMPDIYGLNVLSEIKTHKPFIPVILQTGSSDEHEIKRAFSIGVAGYIKKPYQKKLILDEIKNKLV